MQPVGRHQVARLDAGGGHVARVPLQRGHPGRDDRDAERGCPGGECGVQHGAANPEAVPVPERRVGLVRGVEVADAAQRVAVRRDAERREPPHGGGHDALAARLVDGSRARLGDRDRQARERAVDRSGKSHRAAADDKHVDHGAAGLTARGAAAASARISHRMRTVSSAALSTVKTHAVIHADPVSGSAAPSTMTAT